MYHISLSNSTGSTVHQRRKRRRYILFILVLFLGLAGIIRSFATGVTAITAGGASRSTTRRTAKTGALVSTTRQRRGIGCVQFAIVVQIGRGGGEQQEGGSPDFMDASTSLSSSAATNDDDYYNHEIQGVNNGNNDFEEYSTVTDEDYYNSPYQEQQENQRSSLPRRTRPGRPTATATTAYGKQLDDQLNGFGNAPSSSVTFQPPPPPPPPSRSGYTAAWSSTTTSSSTSTGTTPSSSTSNYNPIQYQFPQRSQQQQQQQQQQVKKSNRLWPWNWKRSSSSSNHERDHTSPLDTNEDSFIHDEEEDSIVPGVTSPSTATSASTTTQLQANLPKYASPRQDILSQFIMQSKINSILLLGSSITMGILLGAILGKSILNRPISFAYVFGILFGFGYFLRGGNPYSEWIRTLGMCLILTIQRSHQIRRDYPSCTHLGAIIRIRPRIPFPPNTNSNNPWNYQPIHEKDVPFTMLYSIVAMILVGSTCGGNIPYIPSWLGAIVGAIWFAYWCTLPNARGDLARCMGMRVVALVRLVIGMNEEVALLQKTGIVTSKLFDKILIVDRQHRIKDRLGIIIKFMYDQIAQTISRIQQQQQQQQAPSSSSSSQPRRQQFNDIPRRAPEFSSEGTRQMEDDFVDNDHGGENYATWGDQRQQQPRQQQQQQWRGTDPRQPNRKPRERGQ